MKCSYRMLPAVFFGVLVTGAFAQGPLQIKWTAEVGDAIKPISINAGEPMATMRMVTFTYEAQKSCKRLSIFGHSYSKDGIQLPAFVLAQRMDVLPGQKFRDEVPVAYEPDHYVVLDKVYCFRS